jgi:FeS assembly SUF system protein
MNNEKLKQIEKQVIIGLKTVYDPEIPVNIYDLGLVYTINVKEDGVVFVEMTLTSPNCPVADNIMAEVYFIIKGIEGVKDVDLNLTFDPPWDRDSMSDEAKLELGLL